MAGKKSKTVWEFGDFQTPETLAIEIVSVLKRMNITPASIIEPTCGVGNLLVSAMRAYPYAEQVIGVDINSQYLTQLRTRMGLEELNPNTAIIHANFFDMNWEEIIAKLPQPLLIIGNPPWVTSADLSTLQSQN
ncbi:MAG: N-6 DNA methylase, partial [Caldilineaceae bacterium]